MGGYRRPALQLTFADPQFEGLEVRCRRISIDETFTLSEVGPDDDRDAVMRLAELLGDGLPPEDPAEKRRPVILDWNLEDYDGTPLPVSAANLRTQDMPLIFAIVAALVAQMRGVPAPLPQTSTDGDPSVEASLPMEMCSDPQPSTSGPEPSLGSSDSSPATP